jgi:hypothetical protein
MPHNPHRTTTPNKIQTVGEFSTGYGTCGACNLKTHVASVGRNGDRYNVLLDNGLRDCSSKFKIKKCNVSKKCVACFISPHPMSMLTLVLQPLKLLRRQARLVEDAAQRAYGDIAGVAGDDGDTRAGSGGFQEFDVAAALGDFGEAGGVELAADFAVRRWV